MTVYNDKFHMPAVIVLEHTTPAQLEALKAEMEAAFDNTPAPDIAQERPTDVIWSGLFNLLCDLEVDGYETS